MHDVMSIKPGKVTGVLAQRSLDDLSPPECCFSVLFSSFSVDIQCDSLQTRNNWIEALNYLVMQFKKEEVRSYKCLLFLFVLRSHIPPIVYQLKAGNPIAIDRTMTGTDNGRRHTIASPDGKVRVCLFVCLFVIGELVETWHVQKK